MKLNLPIKKIKYKKLKIVVDSQTYDLWKRISKNNNWQESELFKLAVNNLVEKYEQEKNVFPEGSFIKNEKEKLLTLEEVMNCVSMTKSTIYRYINKGEFPPPIKMDSTNPASASMWRESDVENFIDTRPRAF